MPRNRLRAMRMKDGKRWTLIYRERAWQTALEEARTRSFLGAVYYACLGASRLLAHRV
jgi:hypothetical protein